MKQLSRPTVVFKWAINLNRHFSKEVIQMANRCRKKYTASLIMKEMQIRITVRYHLSPVRLAVVKKTKDNK